jgi:hypothetical protein
VAVKKAPDSPGRKAGTVFGTQHLGHFDECDVRLPLDRGQDDVAIGLDTA